MKTAIVIPAEGPIRREEIPDDDVWGLQFLQEAVGGHIELVPMRRDDLTMYCNDEGKLDGLPINHLATAIADLMDDILVGDVVLLGPVDRHGDSQGVPQHIADALAPSE